MKVFGAIKCFIFIQDIKFKLQSILQIESNVILDLVKSKLMNLTEVVWEEIDVLNLGSKECQSFI